MSRQIKVSILDDPKDICPICKSNRYLNPSLQFLINPECYHSMCSTCVDRIFTSGPAPCPVPHCGKTLRKKGFHAAFFGDLSIEREVDVRRRVAKVFNRRQDDFETLLDWNNYLQDVEDLVFDIVEGMPKSKAQAEDKLRKYQEGNEAEIEGNRRAAMDEVEMQKRKERLDKEAAWRRRQAQFREEAEGKLDAQQSKMAVLDRLATEDADAETVTKHARKVMLKKSSARRHLQEQDPSMREGLTIRGLKGKALPKKKEPYDPYGGLRFEPTKFVLQDYYENDWLDKTTSSPLIQVGGWNSHDYYARTMFEAFSGLGVVVQEEVADRESSRENLTLVQSEREGSLKTEVLEGKVRDSDDVF